MLECLLACSLFLMYALWAFANGWLTPLSWLYLGSGLMVVGTIAAFGGAIGYYVKIYRCTPKPWSLWMWLHPPSLHPQLSWQQKETFYSWLVVGVLGMGLLLVGLICLVNAWMGFAAAL